MAPAHKLIFSRMMQTFTRIDIKFDQSVETKQRSDAKMNSSLFLSEGKDGLFV